jgi:hypothetical protein
MGRVSKGDTMTTKIAAALLASLTVAAATVACTGVTEGQDPIVAEWEGVDTIGNYRNTMEIEDDLEGEARIYFYYDWELYYADYDVDAKPDRRPGTYELRLKCQGNCAWLDIDMDCEVDADGQKMKCDADGAWSNYDFRWRLD